MIQSELPKILRHIEANESRLLFNRKLLDIYEGAIKKYIEQALQLELSPKAFERARHRIPAINILAQTIDKMSNIYKAAPDRICEDELQQELVDYYSQELDVNNAISLFHSMLNLHLSAALELYYNKSDELKLRVLPADRFLVYSNDEIEPSNPTHFIKFIGGDNRTLFIYSSDEFARVENGKITYVIDNPFGLMPFIYKNLNDFALLPQLEDSNFSLPVLIPVLLTDLNYAAKYLSHSITVAIDANIDGMSANPDAVWNVTSDQDKNGQVTTINPQVDVDKILTLISAELNMWLESKGLKTSSSGNLTESNASGVSKIIDNADTTELRQEQSQVLKKVEMDLWKMIGVIHNLNRPEGLPLATRLNPSITFADAKPFVDPKAELDLIIAKKDNGLISAETAIRLANKDMSSEQVESEMIAIENEGKIVVGISNEQEQQNE